MRSRAGTARDAPCCRTSPRLPTWGIERCWSFGGAAANDHGSRPCGDTVKVGVLGEDTWLLGEIELLFEREPLTTASDGEEGLAKAQVDAAVVGLVPHNARVVALACELVREPARRGKEDVVLAVVHEHVYVEVVESEAARQR